MAPEVGINTDPAEDIESRGTGVIGVSGDDAVLLDEDEVDSGERPVLENVLLLISYFTLAPGGADLTDCSFFALVSSLTFASGLTLVSDLTASAVGR